MTTRPVLIVIAGPNGSGKTALTEKVRLHEWAHDCDYINPDNIALELGDWNADGAVSKIYSQINAWALPIYEHLPGERIKKT